MIDETGMPRLGAPLGDILVEHDDRPALTFAEQTFSARQVDAMAQAAAERLDLAGVRPGDLVGIREPNGPAIYAAAFACWKLGATPCVLSHRLTSGELVQIAEVAGFSTIVGPAIGALRSVRIDTDCSPRSQRCQPSIADFPWKAATSGGSTGLPKVLVDANPARWGHDKLYPGLAPRQTLLNVAPLSHTAPFTTATMGMAAGCHVVELGRFDPLEWLAAIERHAVGWAFVVPTMMIRLARAIQEGARADLSSLRTLFHTAAPCPPWVKRFWIDRLGPDAVWEVYGGTERYGGTLIGGKDWLQHPGSVGRPRENCEAAVLDADGRPLETGRVGEINFRPRAAEAAAPWCTFGDFGWQDDAGFLYIADRRTDMIVSGGANIFPSEVEQVLEEHDGVVCAVAIGLPHPDLGQVVHAVVQHRYAGEAPPALVATLHEWTAQRLAPYKRPRSIELVSQPLRDDAGKVNRSKVREHRLAPRSPALSP